MHALAALLLVILSGPHVSPAVETVARDGKVQTVFGSSGVVGARFSPDGTRVAWAAPDGVHLADADGTNGRLVEPASTTCHVFYTAFGFTRSGAPVYTRNTDRSDVDPFDLLVRSRVVYRFGSSHCECGGLALSPDGGRLAIAMQTTHGNVIRVIDLRNGVAHDIRGYNPAFALSWSPDSTRIAFPNLFQGSWTVDTIAAAGGTAHPVGPGLVATWAHDGELLIVSGNYTQLWASDGRGPERLLFRAPNHLMIDWVDAA